MAVLRMKVMVAGNSAVGKTALVQAFHGDATLFAKNYNMTVGVDLVVKSVNIPDSGAVVEMYLCDCSGKEIFQSSLETHVSLNLALKSIDKFPVSQHLDLHRESWVNLS
uniref:Uncharacterized protein n=1 Tax=Eptatretus burgeri TaxID=7764 RepID=A0A8C4QXB0_EPTBU